MRILYLVDKMVRAGAQRHLDQLIRGLSDQEYHPFVCCLLYPGALGAALKKDGIPVFSLNLRGVMGKQFFQALKQIRQLCLRENIDLIHAYLFSSNLVAPWAGAISSTRVITSRRDDGYWKTAKHVWSLRAGNPLTDKITANSNAVVDYLIHREKAPARKICLIPNGIEPNSGKTSRLENNSSPCRLGALGNLRTVKGYEILFDALKNLKDKDWELFIAGKETEPGYQKKLEEKIKFLGLENKIILKGETPEPEQFLSQLDLFILPSLSEGFSNSLLEAMNEGLPVVATKVGANPDVIRDKKDGILVEPGDPHTLTEALRLLLEEPKKRTDLGIAARQRVAQKFSLKQMLSSYQDLYRTVRERQG